MIRLALVIPTRGTERLQFVRNALRMVYAQTVQPKFIMVCGDDPKDDQPDITYRYRTAYEKISPQEYDLICFWEDDDWYAPDYLQYMLKMWEGNNRPDLFGNCYTIYYNLRIKKYFTWRHEHRASSMNTFIKPGIKFVWPPDHHPYTDEWIWKLGAIPRRVAIEPSHIVSVGIKHGIGKTGGFLHVNKLERYINDDNGFLRNTLDPESYKFYTSLVFE